MTRLTGKTLREESNEYDFLRAKNTPGMEIRQQMIKRVIYVYLEI